jgi:hypothetical protein
MPRLDQLREPPQHVRENMTPVQMPVLTFGANPPIDIVPFTGNPFLRCALPQIGNPVSPDNLRQFYKPGTAQIRLWSPL